MRYFAFVDRIDHLKVIEAQAQPKDEVTVIAFGPDIRVGKSMVKGRLLVWDDIRFTALAGFNITHADRVFISTADPAPFSILIEAISAKRNPPSILLITETVTDFPRMEQPNVVIVDLVEKATATVKGEWRLLETRQRAMRLKESLAGHSNKILIMTQNDPDPDAIASGLGVQALLGRNRLTAPICTFGEVTRNENRSMIKLLNTEVKTISPADVKNFDKVVMVDVQPSYFEPGVFDKVDAVIDHHPNPGGYKAGLIDVAPYIGATATMLYEYLTASEIVISKGLATALLYGIVTDTMYLARGASEHDFNAFTNLWPIASINSLASMSRPRLNSDELGYFVKAIKNRKNVKDMTYIWLGNLKKEDIIPRLADFSLQFGENSWSAVGGVYRSNIVLSIRYTGTEFDAGKLAKSLCEDIGGGGGHRTMAKAVIGLKEFKKRYSVKTLNEVSESLVETIYDLLPPT